MRRYATLEQVMNVLVRDPGSVRAVIQRRRHFNAFNYGELEGGVDGGGSLINPSDHMNWDIFAPGYESQLPRDVPIPVAEVLGVMLTATGNHKIAVRLHVDAASVAWCPFRAHLHFVSFRERYFMKKNIDCSLYLSERSSLSMIVPQHKATIDEECMQETTLETTTVDTVLSSVEESSN